MPGLKETYDVAVVGAGLMGTAAARHLAEAGVKVVVIGPSEPNDKTSHLGVFASHYDQARISRRLDRDRDWSRLSERSIHRYSKIEAIGREDFFCESGSIMAGPKQGTGSAFVKNAKAVGEERGILHAELYGDALKGQFPFFSFPKEVLALYENSLAGWINPRLHVAAELRAASVGGARVVPVEVNELIEQQGAVDILCADGTLLSAQKVIVACGAFSLAKGLLPQTLPMKVLARTVTFFEVGDVERKRLGGMPSVVYMPPDQSFDFYVLPPVRYPDGKFYIKIGGDPEDVELANQSELRDWFKGCGDVDVGRFLRDQLLRMMPDLNYRSISCGSCATSYTNTGKPLIYQQTESVFALTGGNGAGAKCADELGRLGAKLVLTGSIEDEGYETDFRPAPPSNQALG